LDKKADKIVAKYNLIEKKAEMEKKASAFDKVEKIDVSEGLFATKNKETGEIEIKDLEGKSIVNLPDAFGDEIVPIVKVLQLVIDKSKIDKELETSKKEVEIVKQEVEATKQELISVQSSFALKTKIERCKEITTVAFKNGWIKADNDCTSKLIKEGMAPEEANEKSAMDALDAQINDLMKLDDKQLEAFASTIQRVKKVASHKQNRLDKPFLGSADLEKEGSISEILKGAWSHQR
jgi:hypothetical protein